MRTTLRNRLARLEDALAVTGEVELATAILAARKRWRAMTDEERRAARIAAADDARKALQRPCSPQQAALYRARIRVVPRESS